MSIVLESYERDFERFLSTSNKLMNTFHLTEEGCLFEEYYNNFFSNYQPKKR